MKFVLAAVLTIYASLSFAQTPDAGSLLNELLQDFEPSLPEVEPELPEIQSDELPDIPGLKITPKSFSVSGADSFPNQDFEAMLADAVGQPVTIRELRQLTDRIATFYRDNDVLARVFLPRQDVTSGDIRITVQEAKFGRLQLSGELGLVELAALERLVAGHLLEGQIIRLSQVDRVLLLLDDLVGVGVAGGLQAGVNPGETDLFVEVADEPVLVMDLSISNHGSFSTGTVRRSFRAQIASPAGQGGQGSVNLLDTEGSKFFRAGYSRPFGPDGLTVGGQASQMRYVVKNGDAAALNARGSSDSYELQINYPWVRSRSFNLFARGVAGRTDFENQSSGSVTSDYRKRQATATVSANWFDEWQGGGANAVSLGVSQTLLSGNRGSNASALPNRYSVVNLNLSRNQQISESLSLFASARKQQTAANTDSSDNFIAGGVSGVRAYPSGEGSAPEGTAASVEVRWRANGHVSARLFYDWARVNDRDVNVGRYMLRGWGAGADIQLPIGATLSIDWSKPKGDHPNPSQADASRNQDGTRFGIRTWASLSYQF